MKQARKETESRRNFSRVAQRARRTLLFIAFALFFLCVPVLCFEEPTTDVLSYPISQVVFDRNGKLLHASLSTSDEWCIPVPLKKMGKWLPFVVVGIEDKRFFKHCGIDFFALGRACLSNIKTGKVTSGASTITSQLIRISHPRKRTLQNKCVEFWSALRLEKALKKEEILALYLNRAPFGGNLRGVEAASLAYFHKNAEQISLSEAVLLVSILKAPGRLRPDLYPRNAKKIRDRRIKELYSRGFISREKMEEALKENVQDKRYAMPREAAMACRQIEGIKGDSKVIRSSIDAKVQRSVEENLHLALKGRSKKITAAALVIENKTSSVLAYVGNIREGSGLPGSEVDCADAPRSPGSALKPFVYGAAFDAGLLTPASLLADTPISFKGSAPRNFDLSYSGPVSVRHALAMSLNAPAVRVLRMVGYPYILNTYRRLGFGHFLADADHYADSLVLGGCEVTLLELAKAYHIFAMGGRMVPLSWEVSAKKRDFSRVISEGAAYMVTSILKDQRRLLPLYQEDPKLSMKEVAFKTGTSYGLRDAWCVGISPHFTIAVWFGCADGTSSSELVGLRIAAPVFLKIFKELRTDGATGFKTPSDIHGREVCSLSGQLPGKYCKNRISDLAIQDISPVDICDLHKEIDGELFIDWPPELKDWAQKRISLPFTNDSQISQNKIRIIHPARSAELITELGKRYVRAYFFAEGSGELFWYLDGKYIGKEEGGGIFFDVPIGKHRIAVLSAAESDEVFFSVIGQEEAIKNDLDGVFLER